MFELLISFLQIGAFSIRGGYATLPLIQEQIVELHQWLTYKEFTDMVNTAKAITDDLDARYAAFAKAEAFWIQHALTIPWSYEVTWKVTSINEYSKIYTAYGNQSERYVNWETNSDLYTTEDYEAFKAGK